MSLASSAPANDDAGQVNVFLHALFWAHAERLVHKLISLNDQRRTEIRQVHEQVWTLYRDLKKYQKAPSSDQKSELTSHFNTFFTKRLLNLEVETLVLTTP